VEADALEGVEGNIGEAKRRGGPPRRSASSAPPGSKSGACVARVAEELGRSRPLRRKTEPLSERK